MRSIEYARTRGSQARREIGDSSVDLLARVRAHLRDVHRVSLIPLRDGQTDGGRAELDAETMMLTYQASLSDESLLMVLAHELGHLVLHERLSDETGPPDPLIASAYGDVGPLAVARYSPRMYEEAQATAFALELVAPCDTVWKAWCNRPGATIASLAADFGCSTDGIQAQLAHALHARALGESVPSASRAEVVYTEAQSAAACFTGAPAIVDAGPGTGKTATVLRRIEFLLDERDARPSDIIALTFSNEAARELRERIAIVFGAGIADAVSVRTFHGFGMEFLHLHGHHVGLGERFELLDDDRQVETVSALLGEVPCDDIIDLRSPMETARRVVEHINHCKQRLIAADALDESSQLAPLFRAYEAEKRRAGQVDLADLIALPIAVLKQNAGVRAGYATRFPWVIVDEFQDVTRATSRLLRALCGPGNPPWVVGDARQSIYQFLGAAPENVTDFARDFENAHVFALDVNHRSSEAVVVAANQLASLLEHPDLATDSVRVRWRAGTATPSVGNPAVAIAEAATDAAEVEGVGNRIAEWIASDGVSAGDIAVLCRRHADVRRVMLALGRRGIRAQASGLVTPEGAAGDLAAMVTLADAPAASVPRVAYALGRGRRSTAQLNETIGMLLRELRAGGDSTSDAEADDVGHELKGLYEILDRRRDCADAFTALATVLFDHGVYLRRTLALEDAADRQMALIEIVSVLSLAAAHRATHRGMPAARTRVAFGERLRERLIQALPMPLAPRPRIDAVHVMTCHASKGLEFPCVVVMGQTLSASQSTLDWLPPQMRTDRSREEAQANALLFVAVTRAQRSVVVSWARRRSAATRGRDRSAVPLLRRWRETFDVPTEQWIATGSVPDRNRGIRIGNIWGVPMPTELGASALGGSVCPMLSYLETYARARFPEAQRDLYPMWISGVRRGLRRVVGWAIERGVPASDDDARALLGAEWPADIPGGHPHASIYRAAAERMVVAFARAFRPMASAGMTNLDPEIVLAARDGLDVRLDLIAHYRQADGAAVAIAFRPESLAPDERSLNWRELAKGKRTSLVMLEDARPGTTAYVYSGASGRIHEYRWGAKRERVSTFAAGFEKWRQAFAAGEFSADVGGYGCDRCRGRVGCPGWVGAD